jgi:uncharacterized protein (TIGR02466 family)|tara:strand:- start:94 stop:720 length:627 start_codon:yes stop_codon:yes gene_type:complete
MQEPIIHSLFPTPVYYTKMDRGFTKQELNFVNEQKKHCSKNEGNINTKDNYILNRKQFKNLHKMLSIECNKYLEKIICPKNKDLKLYITQSWLNYTENNQYHHRHEHPNSYVSGVLYINSDIKTDSIKFFHNNTYIPISPDIDKKRWNHFNSRSWWFSVDTGTLVMFPSSTTHQVDVKEGNNTRISLAFNTFIKGTLGDNFSLTELKL